MIRDDGWRLPKERWTKRADCLSSSIKASECEKSETAPSLDPRPKKDLTVLRICAESNDLGDGRMRESAIQRGVLRFLNDLPETKAIKLHVGPYMPAGTPDVLCVHEGHAIFFEIKAPGKEPSRVQSLAHRQWSDAGASVYTVSSVTETRQIMDAMM